jgi:hypothetical protein
LNWYSLYVDGSEKSSDITLLAAQERALSYMDASRLLRIAYGTPAHSIRAWRYEHETQAWHAEQAF